MTINSAKSDSTENLEISFFLCISVDISHKRRLLESMNILLTEMLIFISFILPSIFITDSASDHSLKHQYHGQDYNSVNSSVTKLLTNK